jgi:excinuclease ABC subunit C
MTFDELRDKALSLPLAPGVYIMMDKSGQVIYVGKAKKLKNRVSQYFQDSASHTVKTRTMVSKIDSFDVIIAASEFEALVLECSLIKRHMPRYNILLKDDKGYPYIRVDLREDYPKFSMVGRTANDGASYFGPYGGRAMTQNAIDTIVQIFHLPGCNKVFPRDQGKERPCLNHHMGLCDAWCRYSMTQQEYHARMEQAVLLLQGKYKQVAEALKEQMEQAAEELRFEAAAQLRDRCKAIEALGQKQLVTAATMADTDAVGYYQSEAKACFAVLHYVGGNLLDKDYEVLEPADSVPEAVSALVKQYYLARGAAPKNIYLPCEIEDREVFEQMLTQQAGGRRIRIRVPQRGDNVQLVERANTNAKDEAERVTTKEERISGTLTLLGTMLGCEPPKRIESYDISHIAGTDIVASMVVFENGKPLKRDYKRFKLENMDDQDDYASMRQVLTRRFRHYLDGDAGFDQTPDLLLIDGGVAHAATVREALNALGLHPRIVGMVKDNRHRTRALVTPDGAEIGIAGTPAVFALIGRIQEETHRFAITYHRQLRSKRLKYSELDEISGIGEQRKQKLLRQFKSITAIRAASLEELQAVIPANAALAVYQHFHKGE